jgi:hypothetical protein
MKLYWYAIKYPDGRVDERVVDNTSDIVQCHNIEYYFESEAYHLYTWATENKLEFDSGVIEVDLNHKFKREKI